MSGRKAGRDDRPGKINRPFIFFCKKRAILFIKPTACPPRAGTGGALVHKQKVKSYALLRETGPGRQYLTVFLTALVLSAIIYLPFLIIDKGIFVYYGDYNVQQIPFYQMCHDMIRSGEVGWNWYTDLGSNFVGSYAFLSSGVALFLADHPVPERGGALPDGAADDAEDRDGGGHQLRVYQAVCSQPRLCLFGGFDVRLFRLQHLQHLL